MGNDRVDNLLNTTLAGKITRNLAAEQKNQTNTIKANIWNKFVEMIGTGKSIKSEISLENAMNSITKYAVVEAGKQNKTVNELATEWLNIMGLELSSKKPANDVVAAELEDLVSEGKAEPVAETSSVEIDPDCEESFYDEDYNRFVVNRYDDMTSKNLLKQTYYLPDRKTKEFDEEYSPEGVKVRLTEYYPDGKIEFVNEHNDKGQWVKQTNYRADGTLESVNEYNPETGKYQSRKLYSGNDKQGKRDYPAEIMIKEQVYRDDGTLEREDRFSNISGKRYERRYYSVDGETEIKRTEFSLDNGYPIKSKVLTPEGDYIGDHDDENLP